MNNGPITAYIGVGSNIFPEKNILKALDLLQEYMQVSIISTFYRTKPISNDDQDEYLNGVWQAKTEVTPWEMKFSILRKIESNLDRKRSENKSASRTIDLDLLLFEDLIVKEEDLIIPDPEIYERSFISYPLFEIAPTLVLPDTKIKISDLVKKITTEDLQADFEFTNTIRKKLIQN